jgi:hypothetical protein
MSTFLQTLTALLHLNCCKGVKMVTERFEVLTAGLLKIQVSWDVTQSFGSDTVIWQVFQTF